MTDKDKNDSTARVVQETFVMAGIGAAVMAAAAATGYGVYRVGKAFWDAPRKLKAATVCTVVAVGAGILARDAYRDYELEQRKTAGSKQFEQIAANVESLHGSVLPNQRKCLIAAGSEAYASATYLYSGREYPRLSSADHVAEEYTRHMQYYSDNCMKLPNSTGSKGTEALAKIFKGSTLVPSASVDDKNSADPRMNFVVRYHPN